MKKSEIDQFLAHLKEIVGNRPRPKYKPAAEQISAIKHLLESEQNPFPDFSVFRPAWARFQKRLKFTGNLLNAEGVVYREEIYGPGSFKVWRACWELYGLIMRGFKQCNQGALDDYRDHIEELVDRYGNWALA